MKNTLSLRNVLIGVVSIVALLMALFHLYAAGIQILPAVQQRSIHLGFALALTFFIYPIFKKSKRENLEGTLEQQNVVSISINIILAILAVLTALYISINHIDLARTLNNPSMLEVVIATLIIVMTLEVSRRTIGWGLTGVGLFFLLYAFFGQHLPLMFAHTGYRFENIVMQIGLSTEGILGVSLGVSATYIILFIIFGSLLEKSGAGQLFMDLAMGLVGRFRGGAAKVSVVASAFFGSISGSPTSNAVTTGVLTIPLMRKEGYRKEYAAAVESVASTGGMFLPPVMGAVSFLMADLLGVPYIEVMFAALIPAILYFIAVFIMVDLRAAQLKGTANKDYKVPDVKKEFAAKWHLLIPLVVLVYLLVIERLSPFTSAFWAIVAIPVSSYLRRETRMGLKQILGAMVQGVRLSLMVVAACACAGIVIGVINLTGIGLRISGIMVSLAGENLFLLLVLTMIICIIMGLGLPPIASYLILAVFAAPAMIELGVSPMAAHMFVFFFASLAHITPPVAVTVFAASGIAGANPMRTSFVAVRLGLVAFIIPYLFVYGPELLFEGTALSIIYAALTAMVGVFVLAVAMEGYLKNKINIVSRVILLIAALLIMNVGVLSDILGLVLFGFILFYELKINAKKIEENTLPHSKVN